MGVYIYKLDKRPRKTESGPVHVYKFWQRVEKGYDDEKRQYRSLERFHSKFPELRNVLVCDCFEEGADVYRQEYASPTWYDAAHMRGERVGTLAKSGRSWRIDFD